MHIDARAIIDYLMTEKGLTQSQLAREVDIDQATISRLHRRGAYERSGKARLKLLKYAKAHIPSIEDFIDPGPNRVANAFRQIWDGTNEHVVAIVGVIRALAGLKPDRRSGKGRLRERQRKSSRATSKKHRP